MSRRRIDIPGKGLVQFEGIPLPAFAKYMEATPYLASLPEDIRDWVLDLRYAWGRTRTAPSALVLRACDELERRMDTDTAALHAHLAEVFKGGDPEAVCAEWREAMRIMRGCAAGRDTCHWTIEPADDEVEYYVEQVVRLLRGMEKAQKTAFIPKGYEAYIAQAPRAEKLRFVTEMTDALSH